MAKEIERKFLVSDDSYKLMASESHRIAQGYISRRKEGTVRVRILDDAAFMTVKGENHGISRNEWEYPIPVEDAREMFRWNFLPPIPLFPSPLLSAAKSAETPHTIIPTSYVT